MDIIDEIASAGENAVDFAMKQVKNVQKQIDSLFKILDLIKKAENKSNDVQNDLNNSKQEIEKLCSSIYNSSGSNISKSFINYTDNLMQENRNLITKITSNMFNSFSAAKKAINTAINKAEKNINDIMTAIGNL